MYQYVNSTLLPMFQGTCCIKLGFPVQQPNHVKSPRFAGVGVVGRPPT